MLSMKRKLWGYLMYFLTFLCLAVGISDIILRETRDITYRYPWVGSLALLLAFAFMTVGSLLFFWKQERPWRNTIILALGTIFITLTAGLLFTSDLKIEVSYELSSTEEKNTITWYNPKTDETTIWHPYQTIFLKQQPDPIISEVNQPKDDTAEDINDNAASDTADNQEADEDNVSDDTVVDDNPAGAIIRQMKDSTQTVSGSVTISGNSTDKFWIVKNVVEAYAQTTRTDGSDRHIQIGQIEITAGNIDDFAANVSMNERLNTLGTAEKQPTGENKQTVNHLRIVKSGENYCAYRFDTAEDASYGLEALAAPEVQDFTKNGSYHVYMPADYTAAGYTNLTAVPSESVQKLYASTFQANYPDAKWFENNPQTGYQLSDTEYLLYYGITADLEYFQFRHYNVSTGYPVTVSYYLMPFGTNEFIKQ